MLGLARKAAARIVVVEDDWDILEVVKLMLEYEGHQVVTAKHGRAALDQLRRVGRSSEEIAELLFTALGRRIDVGSLDANRR